MHIEYDIKCAHYTQTPQIYILLLQNRVGPGSFPIALSPEIKKKQKIHYNNTCHKCMYRRYFHL